MKLFAYRGQQSNFGDELNHWLWDRLLPGVLDEDDREIFLGIGSILHFRFDPKARKIVFGSGFGGYGTPARPDETWKIYFVRGKRTAAALGIDESLGIGDAGILVRSCWNAADYEKTYDVSFMPHYESAIRGNWEDACARAGVHLIDPRLPVEDVLREMSRSRLVVSEAMHGVIIADALRVPWRAIRPLDPANRDKWYDWASALGVDIAFSALRPSSVVELAAGWLNWNKDLRKKVVNRHRRIRQLTGSRALPGAVASLRKAAQMDGQLSSDAAIKAAHAAMLVELERFKADHPVRAATGRTIDFAGERP